MSDQQISFSYDATTVTFPVGRKYPEQPQEDLRQNRSRAMGGRLVTITHDATPLSDPVVHLRITDAKFTELRNFIYVTVLGSTYAYTFTDYDASTKTVKYIGGIREARRVSHGRWAVEVRMAEVPV